MDLVLAFFTAMVLSVVLTPACGRLAFWIGAVDYPSARKVHLRPMPRLGGVAVYVALAVATLLFLRATIPAQITLLLAGAGAFGLIGFVDDIRDLGISKLVLEAVVVIVVTWLSHFRVNLPWPYAGEILAVLWIVGVANAMNCLDCIDGAAAGAAAVGALALMLLALLAHRPGVATGAAAVTGAALGFLRHNFYPARIFLGDSGSLMLGFLLAGLGAAIIAPGTSPVPWTAVALVLGIPTVDFLLVHAQRYRRGLRNPSELITSTGKDHLPHRLMAMGLPVPVAATQLYVASAVFGGCAVALVGLGPWAGLAVALPTVSVVVRWSKLNALPAVESYAPAKPSQ
ncbi:MAG TPA: MraY family glycosyltransferase [bacterium]|nr:MraY family glycosyltransferase [bacterium]